MKRGKKLGLMVVFLLFLVGATILTRNMTAEVATDVEEDTSILLYTLDEEKLTALTWEYGGETITLCKKNDEWMWEEDENFPVNPTKAENLVKVLDSVNAELTIEKPDDPAQYGLDNPQCTITVQAQEKTVFQIGTEKSMDGLSYLTMGDGKVYLVSSALADAFSAGLYDLVQKESIPSMSQLDRMIVTSEVQEYEIDHIEDSGIAYTDSYEWFLKDGDGYLILDNSLASGFADKIRNLAWQSCVEYQADADNLASYGLDHPAATVEMHYTQSTQVETNLKADDGDPIYETVEEEKIFVLEIGDYADSGCYARIAGSSMVYLVSSSLSDDLLYMDYDDLRPDDVILLDYSVLTGVEVTVEGQTACFEKVSRAVTDDEEETTVETVYLLDGEEKEIEDILRTVSSFVSAGFADEVEAKRTPEISFTFTQESETHPRFELVFYPYDSSYCLVTLDGESTVFVSRYDVEQLKDQLTERINGETETEE
ncbi:MAG: DUF4340 domain-containing protein [Oscillospiraceae bacterium]|nr:DUF4340 domain-containing protein [Oscillospiraceae bacterium]